mmetsp:Transcript_45689/g.95888  ORF Transcript_45689/g.95888 Transcript_45689/m.95888 type:complete len:119 (+) Transcript_45689:184-540(+)
MKSALLLLAALLSASTDAAKTSRKRTRAVRKSQPDSAREEYDPYLGLSRKLDGHEHSEHSHDHSSSHDHGSMSMSMSMPKEEKTVEDDPEVTVKDESGAAAAGTVVAVLATAGAMMLL